jgi:hypothetical protein
MKKSRQQRIRDNRWKTLEEIMRTVPPVKRIVEQAANLKDILRKKDQADKQQEKKETERT